MQRELSVDNEKLNVFLLLQHLLCLNLTDLLPLISNKHSKTDVGGGVAVGLEYK